MRISFSSNILRLLFVLVEISMLLLLLVLIKSATASSSNKTLDSPVSHLRFKRALYYRNYPEQMKEYKERNLKLARNPLFGDFGRYSRLLPGLFGGQSKSFGASNNYDDYYDNSDDDDDDYYYNNDYYFNRAPKRHQHKNKHDHNKKAKQAHVGIKLSNRIPEVEKKEEEATRAIPSSAYPQHLTENRFIPISRDQQSLGPTPQAIQTYGQPLTENKFVPIARDPLKQRSRHVGIKLSNKRILSSTETLTAEKPARLSDVLSQIEQGKVVKTQTKPQKQKLSKERLQKVAELASKMVNNMYSANYYTTSSTTTTTTTITTKTPATSRFKQIFKYEPSNEPAEDRFPKLDRLASVIASNFGSIPKASSNSRNRYNLAAKPPIVTTTTTSTTTSTTKATMEKTSYAKSNHKKQFPKLNKLASRIVSHFI